MVGSLLPLQITELFSNKKCRKIIIYEFEWAFRYQFLAVDALFIGIGHKFFLKPLKLVFCYLMSKFLLNLKFKYSGSMQKEDLSNYTIFDPC
jgi:hypothetical protein